MSESDSEDSRERIRYKTENTRNTSENYDDDSNQKEIIGPSLPPHLAKARSESKDFGDIGPALPPHMIKKSDQELSIGPQLPPKQSDMADNDKSFGPTLPLHLRKQFEEKSAEDSNESVVESFGPSLPPHLKKQQEENSNEDSNKDVVKSFGPSLPDHLRKQLQSQSDDDSVEFEEDVFGPLPPGMSGNSSASIALEERALQMQIEKITPKENPQTVRESWMLELPEVKAANLGLGPRQFRNKAGPDMSDRSSWTVIGSEKGKQKKKEKPLDLKAEAELRELHKRDKEQEIQAKKHKRKSKSLVQMHEDKIKKQKNDSPGTTERKPFNRETDLQVNKFDEAQKKAVLKKAQLLDTRFSTGKSKFL
ncbi:unnamed protein product [Ceutorhynchus assimilis]|uniref:DUF3752 domain-containing protein n=1 Tax=Ceutorhynchus assimilis TaxID=467358 RepID=A0A9N9QQU1_9CUCU|nr:unnamed protein product [Ceutorhynchus assimilis]